jgi:hypothetical protein
MLGEVLGESSGTILGTRVLPSEGQQIKVEVSFQGKGHLLGEEIMDIGTYWQTIRPGGVLYGEGHVLMMTPQGEVADWIGFGVGRPTGPPPAASYAVSGSFQSASQKLSRLNSIVTAIEYEVDENSNYRYKLWEWLPARVEAFASEG